MSISEVRRRNAAEILTRRGVNMVGIGKKVSKGVSTGRTTLCIGVEKKKPLAEIRSADRIPSAIDGEETDIVEIGEIKALGAMPVFAPLEYDDRQRPCDLGVSIAHFRVTAGTLGCLVRRDGATYLLSNNHVLANSNEASIGDEILQPGAYDGGRLGRDTLTYLDDYVDIAMGDGDDDPSQCSLAGAIVSALNGVSRLMGRSTRIREQRIQQIGNLVDCAIAGPVDENLVRHFLRGRPAGLEQVTGILKGVVGMQVAKSGRTTEYTEDEILYTDAAVQVSYGPGQTALFEDQLIAGPMSAGGDSGSLVVERDSTRAVGLLFAGSEQFTIMNRIQNVLAALNCELVTA